MIVKIGEGYNTNTSNSYLRSDFVLDPIFESTESMALYLVECGILTEEEASATNKSGLLGKAKDLFGKLVKGITKLFETVIGYVRDAIKKLGNIIENRVNKFKQKKDFKELYSTWVKNGGLDKTVTAGENITIPSLEKQYKALHRRVSVSKRSFNSSIKNILNQGSKGKEFDTDSATFEIFKSDADKFAHDSGINENNDNKKEMKIAEFLKKMGINAKSPNAYSDMIKACGTLNSIKENCDNLNNSLDDIRKDICNNLVELERDYKQSSGASYIDAAAVLRRGIQEWCSGYKSTVSILIRNIKSTSDVVTSILEMVE